MHDCLAKHMYEAAAFFADKLVTLSGYSPAEVYTLAQAFFCSRQFRRCLQLLRSTELIEKDLRFRYLAARWARFAYRGGQPGGLRRAAARRRSGGWVCRSRCRLQSQLGQWRAGSQSSGMRALLAACCSSPGRSLCRCASAPAVAFTCPAAYPPVAPCC